MSGQALPGRRPGPGGANGRGFRGARVSAISPAGSRLQAGQGLRLHTARGPWRCLPRRRGAGASPRRPVLSPRARPRPLPFRRTTVGFQRLAAELRGHRRRGRDRSRHRPSLHPHRRARHRHHRHRHRDGRGRQHGGPLPPDPGRARGRGAAPALVTAPSLAGSAGTPAGTAAIGAPVTLDPGAWHGAPAPSLAVAWLLDGAGRRGRDRALLHAAAGRRRQGARGAGDRDQRRGQRRGGDRGAARSSTPRRRWWRRSPTSPPTPAPRRSPSRRRRPSPARRSRSP